LAASKLTGYSEKHVFELKTQTPGQAAGFTQNFEMSTSPESKKSITISTFIYGFHQKANFSLIGMSENEGLHGVIHLDTSFTNLNKARLDFKVGSKVMTPQKYTFD